MFNAIVGVLTIPLATGVLTLLTKSPSGAAWLNLGGSLATTAGLFWLVRQLIVSGTVFQQSIFSLGHQRF